MSFAGTGRPRHVRIAPQPSASTSTKSGNPRISNFMGPRPRNFNSRRITGAHSLKNSEGIVRPASLMGVKWHFLQVAPNGKNDLAARWETLEDQINPRPVIPPINTEDESLNISASTAESQLSPSDIRAMQSTSWADQKAARIQRLKTELQKLEEETLFKFHETVDQDQLEAIRRENEGVFADDPGTSNHMRATEQDIDVLSGGEEGVVAGDQDGEDEVGGGPIDVTDDQELQSILNADSASPGQPASKTEQDAGTDNTHAKLTSQSSPDIPRLSRSGKAAASDTSLGDRGSPNPLSAHGRTSSSNSLKGRLKGSGMSPRTGSPAGFGSANSSQKSLDSGRGSPRIHGGGGQFPDRFKPLRPKGAPKPAEIPLSDLEKEISKVEEEAAAIERELAKDSGVAVDPKNPQTMEVDPSLLIWRSTASVREIDSLPEDADVHKTGGGKSLQAMTVQEKKRKVVTRKKEKTKLQILKDSLKNYDTSFGRDSSWGKMAPRQKYGAWYMPPNRWGMADEPIQPVKTIAKLTDPEDDHPLNREQQNLFATKLYKDYIKRTDERVPRYLEDVEDLNPEEDKDTSPNKPRGVVSKPGQEHRLTMSIISKARRDNNKGPSISFKG